MNIISLISDLIHPKPKAKTKPQPKAAESTQQAAARALDRMFSTNRNHK